MRILVLLCMAVASISFSIGKDIGESKTQEQEIYSVVSSDFSNLDVDDNVLESLATTTTTSIVDYYQGEGGPEPEYHLETTTTTEPLPEGKCSEWYPIAIEAGWAIDELNKIGRIMYAESRCIADIANGSYSFGLTQIEWKAHYGWLETEFGITNQEALYDPYVNLLVARWLFDYAEEAYGCGWQPWYMSGDWC